VLHPELEVDDQPLCGHPHDAAAGVQEKARIGARQVVAERHVLAYRIRTGKREGDIFLHLRDAEARNDVRNRLTRPEGNRLLR
jgi:hypothetical protein